MDFQTLTRCPGCLGLTLDRTQGCIDHKPLEADKRARLLLGARGYRLYTQPGHPTLDLVYMVNDDPDDLRFDIVTQWSPLTPQEMFLRLEASGWPITTDHICPECKEADSSGLEWCDGCKDQFQLEGAGKW